MAGLAVRCWNSASCPRAAPRDWISYRRQGRRKMSTVVFYGKHRHLRLRYTNPSCCSFCSQEKLNTWNSYQLKWQEEGTAAVTNWMAWELSGIFCRYCRINLDGSKFLTAMNHRYTVLQGQTFPMPQRLWRSSTRTANKWHLVFGP